MPNVKPGDKAVVIKSSIPRNIGKLVLVIETAADGDKLPSGLPIDLKNCGDTPGWIVESLGSPLLFFNQDNRPVPLMVGPFRDDCLKPIRDVPDDRIDEMQLYAGPAPQVNALTIPRRKQPLLKN